MRRKGKRRSAAQRRATAKMLAAAKRKRRGKGRKKTHNRRKHRHHMAKRKSHSKRRRSTGRKHARRGHRRSGGGGRGLSAVKADATKMVIGAVYGKIESLAAADDNFFLNKLPRPIAAVGYTGNIALALYGATYFSRNHWLRQAASVVATIASYKLGKQGKLYESSDKATIGLNAYGSENDEVSGDERIIDDNVMGALDAEANEFGSPHGGLSYENAVQQAGSRV